RDELGGLSRWKDTVKDGDGRAKAIRREVTLAHRHTDGLMAERLLDLPQSLSALHRPRCERVPEVVEPEVLQAGHSQGCLPTVFAGLRSLDESRRLGPIGIHVGDGLRRESNRITSED